MATLFPITINGFPRNIPKKQNFTNWMLCKALSYVKMMVYPIFSSLNIQEQSRLYKSQSEHFSRQIVDVILPQQEVKAMKVHEEKQKQKKIYTTMMTNVDSHPNVMIRCSYRVFSQIEGQRLIKWMKLQRFFFRLVNYCVWSFSKSCSPASIF